MGQALEAAASSELVPLGFTFAAFRASGRQTFPYKISHYGVTARCASRGLG
jgi:hypothetical protein